MNYYKQIKDVDWLNTPKDTIWIDFLSNEEGNYIQPEDIKLRDTPLGINLNLQEPEEFIELFENIKTIEIKSK